MKDRPIRVGVVGVGRGKSFAESASDAVGMELVALCDTWEERLRQLAGDLSVAAYTDYDEFLTHDMDAVVLANYFNEHAPFAIKALHAGRHVMSETASNGTLAEGVALCRAVEETGMIYMLAENYPYTVFNQEMRRLYGEGEIGAVTYAEGEYNHPMSRDASLRLSPGFDHWRSWIPSTYYCTHALAPLVYITDTRPVSVNAQAIARPERTLTLRRGDPGSVILCRMDKARSSGSSDSACPATATGTACTANAGPWRSPGDPGTSDLARFGCGMSRGTLNPASKRNGFTRPSGPSTATWPVRQATGEAISGPASISPAPSVRANRPSWTCTAA